MFSNQATADCGQVCYFENGSVAAIKISLSEPDKETIYYQSVSLSSSHSKQIKERHMECECGSFLRGGSILCNNVVIFPIEDTPEETLEIKTIDPINSENVKFSEEDGIWCKSLTVFSDGKTLVENCRVTRPNGEIYVYHSFILDDYRKNPFNEREAQFSTGKFFRNRSKLFRDVTYFPLQNLHDKQVADIVIPMSQIDLPLNPSREEAEIDPWINDVVLLKRSPMEEMKFFDKLDQELISYFKIEVPREYYIPKILSDSVECVKCIRLSIMSYDKNQYMKCPHCFRSDLCKQCKKCFKRSTFLKCVKCKAIDKNNKRRCRERRENDYLRRTTIIFSC